MVSLSPSLYMKTFFCVCSRQSPVPPRVCEWIPDSANQTQSYQASSVFSSTHPQLEEKSMDSVRAPNHGQRRVPDVFLQLQPQIPNNQCIGHSNWSSDSFYVNLTYAGNDIGFLWNLFPRLGSTCPLIFPAQVQGFSGQY